MPGYKSVSMWRNQSEAVSDFSPLFYFKTHLLNGELPNRQLTVFVVSGGVFMVKINGEELNVAGKTIAEYLATTNYDPKRIAVERNGDIVFKSQYGETLLQDGDSIEIVSFVGGG